MAMRKAPLLLLIASVAVPAVIACSKDQPAVSPTGPGLSASGAWGTAPPASGSAPAPTGSVPMTGPAPTGSATAPAPTAPAPTATANVLEMAADAAIDLAIKSQATQAAPGMNPEGQAGRATLAEGEHFGMVVTLQPNQCYSVLGFSPPGQVAQLDIKLLAPPLFNVQAGASGANDKNQPVLGKGKAGALCPFLPVPIAYKIDVTAKKGAGRIGVQVFSRAK